MGAGVSTKPNSKDSEVRKFENFYTVHQELGSGAFSVVKLVAHKETSIKYAAKIIAKKKLSDEDKASLITEISLLSTLDHPNIIKLIEVFEDEDEFVIVMELVEGGELFDRIVSKSHYSEDEARNLVKKFLETMAYMHESDIVHRDLKPENLLLTSENDDADIKIADFGFAKKISQLLPNETACGTPGYVAPEILKGVAYTSEVDIWSMGVIVYVLLAGYPPFYDEDQKKLFKKIKEGKYYFHEDYWGHVSPEAIDLIKHMLCVSQKDRWSARQLLQHPWMLADDMQLKGHNLNNTLVQMKKFNARRRLKAAMNTVIMANRLKNVVANFKKKALAAPDVDPDSGDKENAFFVDPTNDGPGSSSLKSPKNVSEEGIISNT